MQNPNPIHSAWSRAFVALAASACLLASAPLSGAPLQARQLTHREMHHLVGGNPNSRNAVAFCDAQAKNVENCDDKKEGDSCKTCERGILDKVGTGSSKVTTDPTDTVGCGRLMNGICQYIGTSELICNGSNPPNPTTQNCPQAAKVVSQSQ